jgi:HD-like signal output (HDOD) protein
MQVACENCAKSYNLPDDRLPKGKLVTFPCPSCKSKITLDLRQNESLGNTNRLVFKPLDHAEEKSLDYDDLKKKIIKRVDDLPPMPKVMIKAREIMADPNSSFKEIAQVIETDQAIAARVLKIANSAYYGLSGMVSSIHQATVVLGYKTLEQVITMVSSSSMLGKQLKGYKLNAGVLWKHSLATALASRAIAQKRAPSMESDAFSVGLIHDAGKLALDPYVASKRKELEAFMASGTQSASFVSAEKQVLGFDHSEIALELCKKWKLPETHAVAMRFHHFPNESGNNQLAYIVYVANYIARLAGHGCGLPDEENAFDPKSLETLRLKQEDVENITVEVTSAVEDIIASIN